jgi:hypothetical protein
MSNGILDSIFGSSRVFSIAEIETTDRNNPPLEGPKDGAEWLPDYDNGPPSANGTPTWPVNDDSWGHPREAKPAPESTYGEYQPYMPWGFESTPSRRFVTVPWDGKTADRELLNDIGRFAADKGRFIGPALTAVGSGLYLASQELKGTPYRTSEAVGGLSFFFILAGSALTLAAPVNAYASENSGGVKKIVTEEEYRCWADAVCDLTRLPNFLKF